MIQETQFAIGYLPYYDNIAINIYDCFNAHLHEDHKPTWVNTICIEILLEKCFCS
jgi:hypothetical protein